MQLGCQTIQFLLYIWWLQIRVFQRERERERGITDIQVLPLFKSYWICKFEKCTFSHFQQKFYKKMVAEFEGNEIFLKIRYFPTFPHLWKLMALWWLPLLIGDQFEDILPVLPFIFLPQKSYIIWGYFSGIIYFVQAKLSNNSRVDKILSQWKPKPNMNSKKIQKDICYLVKHV